MQPHSAPFFEGTISDPAENHRIGSHGVPELERFRYAGEERGLQAASMLIVIRGEDAISAPPFGEHR